MKALVGSSGSAQSWVNWMKETGPSPPVTCIVQLSGLVLVTVNRPGCASGPLYVSERSVEEFSVRTRLAVGVIEPANADPVRNAAVIIIINVAKPAGEEGGQRSL